MSIIPIIRMKDIYAIEVVDRLSGFGSVSTEAYNYLAEAQQFILSRSDKPVQKSNFIFESKSLQYRIIILQLKEGETND